MGDKTRGLYHKFDVQRTDGTDAPGGKHHGCDYFVLDPTHDPHAIPALLAYADSAERDGYDLLAADLRARVAQQHTSPAQSRDCEPHVPLQDLRSALEQGIITGFQIVHGRVKLRTE